VPDITPAWAGLRVALVHDWLTGMRGGEKVLESICRLFPGADLLTLVRARGAVSAAIESHRIRPSIVQRLPRATRWYRQYLPVFPFAVEQFDLDDADLVISTSHCAAKSVVPTGRSRHLCYCHSPMRYGWDQFEWYFGRERLGALGHAAARQALAPLARWDRDTAHRVDRFVANSAHVAGRIARYYNRQATVLHPPVDTAFFTPEDAPPAPYFLVVSALVPYKRIELAIDAARQLNAPLTIAGTGPDEARLRARAGGTVEFAGAVTDQALRDLYRRALALVLPGEEDFGIAPVEAMACGRPVVALGRGGATETVRHGVTGWLVDEARPDALAAAMRTAQTTPLDPGAVRAHAEQFSVARFESAFAGAVTSLLAEPAC
jgi:glycosyltransferase involved in cell wall biosynthesis